MSDANPAGLTVDGIKIPTARQDAAILRGAARENLDLTAHGQRLTDGQGSPDVIINNEGAWRERISKHTCTAHGEEIVLAGVQQIYINDVRAVRHHDYLKGSGPGDPIVTGSEDVFMGDDPFGITDKEEFCKKFNELMSKWPTMTAQERQDGLQSLIGDVATSKGMPAAKLTTNTGTDANGRPIPAYFSPDRYELNIPRDQNQLYARTGSNDIFNQSTLSDKEQCQFGRVIVHELRHQQMAWNGLRKIAATPGIESQLARWPATSANLPKDVWNAARNSPIPAGSPEDTSGTNAVWDYYNNEFAANHSYIDTPGGSDAARHEFGVGCCNGAR